MKPARHRFITTEAAMLVMDMSCHLVELQVVPLFSVPLIRSWWGAWQEVSSTSCALGSILAAFAPSSALITSRIGKGKDTKSQHSDYLRNVKAQPTTVLVTELL